MKSVTVTFRDGSPPVHTHGDLLADPSEGTVVVYSEKAHVTFNWANVNYYVVSELDENGNHA